MNKTKNKRSVDFRIVLVLLFMFSILPACGGGGGSSSATPAQNQTTPNETVISGRA